MLAFVEALYLRGFREEAAALSPLVGAAAVRSTGAGSCSMATYIRTRAALAAAAAGRYADAERHFVSRPAAGCRSD